jgi:hypothetical protein
MPLEQRSQIKSVLHAVTDESLCSSTQGPICALVQINAGKPSSLLDGVLFPAKDMADWDTLFSTAP